jgi:uncharacterized protein YjbJ (UPF0337 family)
MELWSLVPEMEWRRMEAGKGDQAKGNAQNAIGGIKDTLPGK